ncbi:hypothetical protein [Arthrospira platensis]|jgi:hypothetical protein|uniref:Transposase n=1 Tax=Limnospira platensis NIES-46 TaxID=1236695 RepID=A0A5M3T900_LIMPL|nr:hypothetical protein [Arthrospira platensis]AMW29912.1 hypothetical protein AP285_20230 [Arthrospira platensis YZ]KDR54303.1 hypothetical protein APPUASWS_030010 [Arthrospira platensis str. Paraca]MBD2669736.1 hypothetical protein [Arthrospira platensis FACHB-439]MBD2710514.1 hypothetical protein [Arthrospira platensis FACHB-835]MDF2212052.1 hypothetical protein [Arthrospira platensis NCB002]MDT9184392.1 hypothetical protein [Limnospira sp. PMC 289.06]MDT9296504.1 hypothetical protein [Ar
MSSTDLTPPVHNYEDIAISPTLLPTEETTTGALASPSLKKHPQLVSTRMIEYLGHAFFIVMALIVIDCLQYRQPISTEIGVTPHLQDLQIIRRLKNRLL